MLMSIFRCHFILIRAAYYLCSEGVALAPQIPRPEKGVTNLPMGSPLFAHGVMRSPWVPRCPIDKEYYIYPIIILYLLYLPKNLTNLT